MRIDLNADVGEGSPQEAGLIPLVTSVNIACGGHAGDQDMMKEAVERARRAGVQIGAHPGFEDPAHFGRRELELPLAEVEALVRRQLRRLREVTPMRHVKPHGGLYNVAAKRRDVADAIAAAVAGIDDRLILVGLAGSHLERAAAAFGLPFAGEAIADRTYPPDGTLTPRGDGNALINDPDAAVAQVLSMIREGRVQATDGTWLPVQAQTVCLHGDGAHAIAFARRLRAELADAGVQVAALA